MAGERGGQLRREVAAGGEWRVEAAPGPRPQRGRVGVPGVAPRETGARGPGSPQPREQLAGFPGRAVPRRDVTFSAGLGRRRCHVTVSAGVGPCRERPRPVPVVQVEPPQPGRVMMAPAAWPSQVPGQAQQRDLSRAQLCHRRPRQGEPRVERAVTGRPAHRACGGRRREQPLAGLAGCPQQSPLRAQPGPVRRLPGRHVRGRAAHQRELGRPSRREPQRTRLRLDAVRERPRRVSEVPGGVVDREGLVLAQPQYLLGSEPR